MSVAFCSECGVLNGYHAIGCPLRHARSVSTGTFCSNARHPNAAWHQATPLSASWIEQFRQWWRTRKYGRGCVVRAPSKEGRDDR